MMFGFPENERIAKKVTVGANRVVTIDTDAINNLNHSCGSEIVAMVLDIIERKDIDSIFNSATIFHLNNGELIIFENMLGLGYEHQDKYGVLFISLQDFKQIKHKVLAVDNLLERVYKILVPSNEFISFAAYANFETKKFIIHQLT